MSLKNLVTDELWSDASAKNMHKSHIIAINERRILLEIQNTYVDVWSINEVVTAQQMASIYEKFLEWIDKTGVTYTSKKVTL